MVVTMEALVRDTLAGVMDPEIPVCSITDLGIVERVAVTEDVIAVTLLPTFSGCPALDAIRTDVERALIPIADGRAVEVRYVFDPPWTTDRITAAGREALRSFGISPPGQRMLELKVRCPNCGSLETVLESEFGPTPCRSIRYCTACRNPFEGFKPKIPEE